MPLAKVSKQHQITIPKAIFTALGLQPGDFVEIEAERDRAVLTPQKVISAPSAPDLSDTEQRLLRRARRKIATIKKDLLGSNGLTEAEANVAASVGLIDPAQKWWWLEEWQAGEREAELEKQDGHFDEFHSAQEFLDSLKG